jgi:hypothetical protein
MRNILPVELEIYFKHKDKKEWNKKLKESYEINKQILTEKMVDKKKEEK